jgi:1-deoxy-D-xylulose-5-phosphate synthase
VEEALQLMDTHEKISIGKAKCLAHGTEMVLSNGPIGKNVSLALANLGQPKNIS